MIEGHGSKNPRSARRNTLEQAGDRRRMASGGQAPAVVWGRGNGVEVAVGNGDAFRRFGFVEGYTSQLVAAKLELQDFFKIFPDFMVENIVKNTDLRQKTDEKLKTKIDSNTSGRI